MIKFNPDSISLVNKLREKHGDCSMNEKLDSICFNCSSFFTDVNDLHSDLGVCLNDEAFEEYLDEESDKYVDKILEYSDFSLCLDLYKEKRFDGNRDVCDDYAEIEIIEDEDEENERQMTDEELDLRYEALRAQDVSDIAKYLNGKEEEKNKAVSVLFYLMNFKNKNAFISMLNYYKNLPPVESIDDVHSRLKILDKFYYFNIEDCNNDLVEMLVGELHKMHSNNTTRQLFSSILEFLYSFRGEDDIVIHKLWWLLDNRKFSTKMEKNILYVIKKHENMEPYHFF